MTLYEQLQTDWKIAFKAREIVKKDILNYIIAQIKTKQIDTKKDLTEDEVMKVIKKEIKSRRESIVLFTASGNTEEVALEEQRIAILEVYLPEMLSEEQLKVIVTKKITDLNIVYPIQQRGQIIGTIMKEYGAQVDGALLNQIISHIVS